MNSLEYRNSLQERKLAKPLIVVKAARDEETRVWFVEFSDLFGLNIEADTLEELIDKLPAAVGDLIQEGALDDEDRATDREYPIELIAHASTRLLIRAAA